MSALPVAATLAVIQEPVRVSGAEAPNVKAALALAPAGIALVTAKRRAPDSPFES